MITKILLIQNFRAIQILSTFRQSIMRFISFNKITLIKLVFEAMWKRNGFFSKVLFEILDKDEK